MFEVQVKYFAIHREQKGCTQETVQCALGTTVESLYNDLFALEVDRIRTSFAVNLVQVSGNTVLNPGDEIAFLPPIGGG